MAMRLLFAWERGVRNEREGEGEGEGGEGRRVSSRKAVEGRVRSWLHSTPLLPCEDVEERESSRLCTHRSREQNIERERRRGKKRKRPLETHPELLQPLRILQPFNLLNLVVPHIHYP